MPPHEAMHKGRKRRGPDDLLLLIILAQKRLQQVGSIYVHLLFHKEVSID
jgi:hypothetical protein